MTLKEAEQLAIQIQREVGSDIVDPSLIPLDNGTWTVYCPGFGEFGSPDEWDAFKNWEPDIEYVEARA